MTIQQLLDKLDDSQDDVERLIGADWLEEQGFLVEATFYRWLINMELEPIMEYNYVFWHKYNNENSTMPIGRHHILDEAIWNALENPFFFQNFKVAMYDSRSEAIAALRLAFRKVNQ